MKKIKLIKKRLLFLLVFSLSICIFAGCQSKSPINNVKTPTNKSMNTGAMKQKMQDSIKPLVVNKTITQVQEDKIVMALTSKDSQSSKDETNKQLTKLVSDKVITQSQSDAVTNAIKVNTTKPTMK